MLDLFNIAKPQGCDIQTFYGVGDSRNATKTEMGWTKPRGVSHVYMLAIGGGGNGDGAGTGGGSGAVTVWYGAAQHVPDTLKISPSSGDGLNSLILYRSRAGNYTLVTGNGASGGGGGSATAANYFAAMGFYQSIAGQNGSTSNPGASSTTFLSAGGNAATITGNYGYSLSSNNGIFMLQPIIVGVGATSTGNGGIGCGAGGAPGTTNGGPGMILIASW